MQATDSTAPSILHEKGPRARTSRARLILLSGLLMVALACVGWLVANVADTSFLVDDFVEYWAAGRLNMTGGDPYSAEQLMDLQRSVGWDEAAPLMMWNPPPTLTLVMPFGLLGYASARLLWMAINLFLLFVIADALWRIYGGTTQGRWLVLVIALSFMPTLFVLRIGQIGVFILAGLAGFLAAVRRERWWAAGAMLPLIAIKPHVAYLFWVMLALWWLRQRRWQMVGGALFAGGMAWLIPTLINPHVNQQYIAATTSAPPLFWVTTTWGAVLRLWLGLEREWLAFVPPLIGLMAFGLFVWRTRAVQRTWTTEMPWLLLLSTSTMAFGWPFDLVVLLPAVVQMAIWLLRSGSRRLQGLVFGAFLVYEGAAYLLTQAQASAVYYVWMAPVLLVAYWWLRRQVQGDAQLTVTKVADGQATDRSGELALWRV